MEPSGIVTLITDFGTADGAVGAMKGSALRIHRDVVLCDISHDITPQHIHQGAWCLRRAAAHFPPGTVHLAVVDPGVGSSRSGLVVETERYLLVGPDNGLLSLAARDDGLRRVFHIREDGPAWRKSSTFDGLTLFMPVAAHLSAGMPVEEVGASTDEFVTIDIPEPAVGRDVVEGQLLFFDRFGNGITNVRREHVGTVEVASVMAGTVQLPFCHHYSELAAAQDGTGALWNADGYLELTVNGGSYESRHGLVPGERVEVRLGSRRSSRV